MRSWTRSSVPQPPRDTLPRTQRYLVNQHHRDGHPAPTGRVAAVVPAAGAGVRLGAGIPKAFVELCGRTMLERAVEGLLASGVVDDVVAVVPDDRVAQAESMLAGLAGDDHLVVVTTGGAERTDSVRNGLAALGTAHPGGAAVYDVLLVHDAARCLTPAAPVRRVVEAVRSGRVAVVPTLPVIDTVKQVDDDGYVVGTPDRAALRAVQTPQGFTPAILLAAYDSAGDVATDDAGLVERYGERVSTVDGDPAAFKITTAEDRARALTDLAGVPPGPARLQENQ